MTKQDPLDNPTGQAVAVFTDSGNAEKACDALIGNGFASHRVRLIRGLQAAESIDASLKWFADTDDELAKLKLAVAGGKSLVCVSLDKESEVADVERVCREHGGDQLAHFGQWVLERKAL